MESTAAIQQREDEERERKEQPDRAAGDSTAGVPEQSGANDQNRTDTDPDDQP
jgi:hypothetical protein